MPLPSDTAKKPPPADTIKAPLAHAEQPTVADSSGTYHLDRAAIFAYGATTVGDLLARIPGATQFSTGWMAAPNTDAYLGDAARVRVFVDGLEYSSLDPHSPGVLDYAQIPLWPIESVTVERSPSEIRVYLNTWRVNRTTPYTRTDISSGDLQTNLYRGYFGRRFDHGEALQFGAQEYGTAPTRGGATSDQLSLMARLGWARGKFSFDALMLQVGSHRGTIVDPYTGDSIPHLQATRRSAYVRVGYGDPDAGPWIQGTAATTRYIYSGGSGNALVRADSTAPGDTAVSQSQYVLAGGLTEGGIRLSGTARYFAAFDHPPADTGAAASNKPRPARGLLVPSLRASYAWWRLGLSAYAEGKGIDSTSRNEASAVFTPLSFLRLSASVGTSRDQRVPGSALSPGYQRLEAGLRLHDVWVSGGVISRGAARLAAPTLVDDSLVVQTGRSATATFASMQGRVWKAVHADAYALRWNDENGLYRPQYQTRTQVYVSTALLGRFPDNSFHFFLGLTHEYRSATYFPYANGAVARMPGYRSIGAQLEIRIERAVISYQFSNALGEQYMQVPGFLMPRQTSIYGVRWEFWN
ncbi:MAG TPA: Plug domain-containing protein [Gemmatimonadaceae bacterium]